ncbi:MAG: hypothetical protein OEX06_05030, partial [Candidatus Bathyarchaeota archaeon]|nr:hypothetical protein [Candidatus Bathyarchaeota archaeon]
ALLTFLSLMTVPFAVQATTITACTFDKDTYHQGETGYITVTINNDKENKIRVTGLSATIEYYYTDENPYKGIFETNATLPSEIQPGNSSTFYIPFSLPTNIASGYTKVYVKAVTELWNPPAENWFASEHLTYQPLLYIESPYKEQLEEQVTINEQLEDQLEEQQTINEQLEGQLEEQLATNKNVTNMMYLFGATTIVFAAVTVFLFIVNRRVRVFTQPIA